MKDTQISEKIVRVLNFCSPFLTHRGPRSATLLDCRESVARRACGELDDLGCQFLRNLLLVNLALDNRADFRRENDGSFLAAN